MHARFRKEMPYKKADRCKTTGCNARARRSFKQIRNVFMLPQVNLYVRKLLPGASTQQAHAGRTLTTHADRKVLSESHRYARLVVSPRRKGERVRQLHNFRADQGFPLGPMLAVNSVPIVATVRQQHDGR